MIKKLSAIALSIALFLMFFTIVPSVQSADVVGKVFYTKANIWYEHPEKIYSTNYHRGAIIPVGTKVTVTKFKRKEIRFRDESGVKYRIVYVRKHSPGVTVQQHFDRYFSGEDVMRSGGPFDGLTDSEKKSVKAAVINEGMSKEAVLMSYGYPPPVRTPNLQADLWTFMRNRFATMAVRFRDNVVVNVQ